MSELRNRALWITASIMTMVACADSVGVTTPDHATLLRVVAAKAIAAWSEPELLDRIVNAAGFENRNASISVNGKSLYFGSDRPGGSGALDLYVSHRANPGEPWEAPINLGPTINATAADNNPYLSDDELDLFFNSTRSGGCGGVDLWTSHRENANDDLGWSAPVNLGCGLNSTGGDSGPVLFTDPSTGVATLFLASTRPGGQGINDFWMSTRQSDGSWGVPVVIQELSTPFEDNKLAITRDGLTVYFSSNRPGGSPDLANFNIWVATRESTQDTWSTPTLAIEAAGLPAISTNGKSLYMVRRDVAAGPFKNHLAVSQRTMGGSH
jgi:hypothetical protein